MVYVSDRFLSPLGKPDDLIGYELEDLLPALGGNDPRRLQQQLSRARRIEFDHQSLSRFGERSWHRVTVLPCDGLGEGLAAVVFAKDITPTGRTLAQLRDATVALAKVESELQRRVSRDVHDGPVQLLAAIMFQLGMSETDEAGRLEQLVEGVTVSLRDMIEELSADSPKGRGALLEQWIAPLLINSEIEVKVKDLCTSESGAAEAQAAFVFVYRTIRGIRDPTSRRIINVTLTDERGGERIVASSPSTQPAVDPLVGFRAAQFRANADHARALGGTLSTWLDDDGIRSVSMWIPKLDQSLQTPPEPTEKMAPLQERAPPVRARNDLSLLPALSDSAWTEVAGGAPERLFEYDDQMRISFINPAYQEILNTGLDQLVGVSVTEIFAEERLVELAGVFERLDAGEFVETDWSRTNQFGDSRLINMTLSPRLDEAGKWLGMLGVSEDRTDVGLWDEVRQTTLADLSFARRSAFEASIRRLEEPLAKCEQLVDRIEQFERTSPEPEVVRSIKLELISALRSIKSSTRALALPPQASMGDLDDALRESLGATLESCQLIVVDTTVLRPPAEVSEVIFRIAREAVNNAVLHGGAGRITITISSTAPGISCTIHDEGIGVTADRLQHRPGHLGVQAMQERAREQGGTCRIEKHQVVGTLVSVWLPHQASSAG